MGFLIWTSRKRSQQKEQSSTFESHKKQPINWQRSVMQKYIDEAQVD